MKLKSRNTTSYQQDQDLIDPMSEWLSKNPGFNKSRLINMAVRHFITTEHKLVPVETVTASDKQASEIAKKMMKKHAHMLEKLK
ncbi:hypothetical protein [Aquicella lusitana]|uniref:Uncharacterized protein n=1 Tax=Aquicella lusitana TaxID=254246 RepID=A0A370GMG7_9COXI|nr:hypothetical protein [Aquicella lusitana]RDI44847.1 hypothetical protein C8D86_108101 [Aquicella lusitana]VVC73044.1 hypothetical protein AQULUS_07720 [Aquicella lusitana]